MDPGKSDQRRAGTAGRNGFPGEVGVMGARWVEVPHPTRHRGQSVIGCSVAVCHRPPGNSHSAGFQVTSNLLVTRTYPPYSVNCQPGPREASAARLRSSADIGNWAHFRGRQRNPGDSGRLLRLGIWSVVPVHLPKCAYRSQPRSTCAIINRGSKACSIGLLAESWNGTPVA